MPTIAKFSIATDGERRVATFVDSNGVVSSFPITEEQEASSQAFLGDLQAELESAPAPEEPAEVQE